uniref:Uncharacterized protein n=1 Tax=Arundo donax TaxID=35708 RepID=A0A0A9C032_ARUDO
MVIELSCRQDGNISLLRRVREAEKSVRLCRLVATVLRRLVKWTAFVDDKQVRVKAAQRACMNL